MSMMIFYREQAAVQHLSAAAATLEHVRSRSLRAASAWTNLADRAERAQAGKHARDAAKLSTALHEPSENPDLGRSSI